jgi:hypothetical protein
MQNLEYSINVLVKIISIHLIRIPNKINISIIFLQMSFELIHCRCLYLSCIFSLHEYSKS